MNHDFTDGIKDSLPITAGYFGVSMAFGIMAASYGLSPLMAGLISVTNLTSAGQFAGLSLMVSGTTVFELFLTQLIINMRYALMSLALSQKIAPGTGTIKRMVMSFDITDEIFAVAVSRKAPVTLLYMCGLVLGPIIGWTGGTLTGAFANNSLPASAQSALGVALYAMFIAIVLPPARKDHNIMIVALIALIVSCAIYYLPMLSFISSGFSIIISTLLAAGLGAYFFPISENEKNKKEDLDERA